MSNSGNGGSGGSNQDEIKEIVERVLTIEEALRKLKEDIPKIGGSISLVQSQVIHIINDDSGPPGRVMIDPNDLSKSICLADDHKVTFQNDSDHEATLKLPIGPFKTLHEETVLSGKKVHFNLNKKLNTTDPNAAFTFDYSVEPSGNGGGPNIIIRP